MSRARRVSCGPVALNMVFENHHILCSLSEIVARVAPGPKGSTMLSLREMAESRGLKAVGWKLTFGDLVDQAFPVVAFINGNHYVVVDSVIHNAIVCVRDAGGERRVTREQFLQMWHGETLVFGE